MVVSDMISTYDGSKQDYFFIFAILFIVVFPEEEVDRGTLDLDDWM